jgi:hypothetical protein
VICQMVDLIETAIARTSDFAKTALLAHTGSQVMMRLRMLAAAGLILLVSLAGTAAHAGDGQRALGLLPRNTSLVATWNVARSRLSPVGDEIIDILADSNIISGTVQRLRKSMGLDWKRDVDTVILGMDANVSASAQIVMLIEGKFDQTKLAAAAQKEPGFRGVIHRGVAYYQIGKADVAFLDGYWITTRRGAMTRIIDLSRSRSGSARSNQELMDLLKSVNMGTDLWAIMVVPKRTRQEIASETGSWTMQAVTASVDLRKRVRARVRLGLSDRDGVIAVGQWLQSKGPTHETIQAMGLSEAVRGVSVSRRETNLDLAITIPEEDMAKLERYLRARAAQRATGSGS